MSYENGAGCWQGPSRSASVEIRCGVENSLIHVEETERCVYSAVFETPARCSIEEASKVRATVAAEVNDLAKAPRHDEV